MTLDPVHDEHNDLGILKDFVDIWTSLLVIPLKKLQNILKLNKKIQILKSLHSVVCFYLQLC